MIIGFIGDVVGKHGRDTISYNLQRLRDEFNIDLVIANYENASHGFGLSAKNATELFGYGIDIMTGGNHSFDKKEIVELFSSHPILRPLNYPKQAAGEGIYKTVVKSANVAVVNIMGYYGMPMVDNPFTAALEAVDKLADDGYKHIIVDIHAEATSEKNVIFHLLREKTSAILGTHTHVGTDDLSIYDGCCYVTDVGLTGCMDGVIGMDAKAPINRFLTGASDYFDIPKECKSIFQMVVFELNANGRALWAKKLKIYNNEKTVITDAFFY